MRFFQFVLIQLKRMLKSVPLLVRYAVLTVVLLIMLFPQFKNESHTTDRFKIVVEDSSFHWETIIPEKFHEHISTKKPADLFSDLERGKLDAVYVVPDFFMSRLEAGEQSLVMRYVVDQSFGNAELEREWARSIAPNVINQNLKRQGWITEPLSLFFDVDLTIHTTRTPSFNIDVQLTLIALLLLFPISIAVVIFDLSQLKRSGIYIRLATLSTSPRQAMMSYLFAHTLFQMVLYNVLLVLIVTFTTMTYQEMIPLFIVMNGLTFIGISIAFFLHRFLPERILFLIKSSVLILYVITLRDEPLMDRLIEFVSKDWTKLIITEWFIPIFIISLIIAAVMDGLSMIRIKKYLLKN